MFSQFNFEIQSSEITSVFQDGTEYTVIPTVFFKAGVRNGLLLPASEVEKHFEAWNDSPVTIGHPRIDDVFVSAKSQTIPKIGRIFDVGLNAGGSLKAKIWVENSEKTKDFIANISDGTMRDVSGGFFHDLEQVSGTFQGEYYSGIIRNIIPDHVAVLMEETGACSKTDGCGVPRTMSKQCNCNKSFSTYQIGDNEIPLSSLSWLVENEMYEQRIGYYPIFVYRNFVIATNGISLSRIDYDVNLVEGSEDEFVVTFSEPQKLTLNEDQNMTTQQLQAAFDDADNGREALKEALTTLQANPELIKNIDLQAHAIEAMESRLEGIENTISKLGDISNLQAAIETFTNKQEEARNSLVEQAISAGLSQDDAMTMPDHALSVFIDLHKKATAPKAIGQMFGPSAELEAGYELIPIDAIN